MESDLCRLTIIYTPDAEQALIDLMETTEPPLQGFTTWRASGHGVSFETASHAERVAGRVTRGVLTMVIGRSRAEMLLEQIQQETPIPTLMFWIEPVLAAGRLA